MFELVTKIEVPMLRVPIPILKVLINQMVNDLKRKAGAYTP